MKEKAKELLIKTRRRLFGQNVGNNISAFAGNGIDFAELKEYSYGDDVRRINWNVTAREQKPYVNVFNEERELNVVVALLICGSVYFGSVRQKQEVMAEILGLLSFAAIKNSDRVSTLFFDEKPESFFKPTKNPKSLYIALEHALEVEVLERRVDLQSLSDYLLNSIKQRSIVVLVGDFYEIPDFSFLAARHELYVVVVRDRFEENPILEGEYGLIDPVTNVHNVIEIDDRVVSAFRDRLLSHDKELWEHFGKHRISSTKIYTDEDPFVKLRELFK